MLRIVVALLWAAVSAHGQISPSSRIFAHNDYEKAQPFELAYSLEVGFIEADIFLSESDLLVAHEEREMTRSRNLESMYLKPLQEKIRNNNGHVYSDKAKSLTLMIDIKTEGMATLRVLADKLRQYPALTACATLYITISGNVPATKEWSAIPSFITFDGRPKINYTEGELKRVRLISDDFRKYSSWSGSGQLSPVEETKLKQLIKETHNRGKPLRLWASPDTPEAWKKWNALEIDVINTDNVAALHSFVTTTGN